MKPGRDKRAIALGVALLVVVTYTVDLLTGYEISVAIFYLIPVALVTWYFSRTAGLLVSVLCAAGWLLAEQVSGAVHTNALIPWWNMLVRLGFFVIVTQTLATRRRMESELVAARAAALEATNAKSDFVSRVTHELRTPLTAILGFAELLLKRSGPYLTPEDKECLRRIRVNSESLLGLVDGVLDVGRAEARALPVRESVDLFQLATAVAADIRSRALPVSVQLNVEASPGLAPVETDPALVRQILLNLVANAAKFTESGSIRVSVLGNPQGRPERIVVQDTGIGIFPEKLQTIFEPFEQADGSIHRRYGGAGLGLAIAKELCNVLGYGLAVDSTPGVGSTFSVIIGSSAQSHSSKEGHYIGV